MEQYFNYTNTLTNPETITKLAILLAIVSLFTVLLFITRIINYLSAIKRSKNIEKKVREIDEKLDKLIDIVNNKK
jgi:uncharacterized membrane protein